MAAIETSAHVIVEDSQFVGNRAGAVRERRGAVRVRGGARANDQLHAGGHSRRTRPPALA